MKKVYTNIVRNGLHNRVNLDNEQNWRRIYLTGEEPLISLL